MCDKIDLNRFFGPHYQVLVASMSARTTELVVPDKLRIGALHPYAEKLPQAVQEFWKEFGNARTAARGAPIARNWKEADGPVVYPLVGRPVSSQTTSMKQCR